MLKKNILLLIGISIAFGLLGKDYSGHIEKINLYFEKLESTGDINQKLLYNDSVIQNLKEIVKDTSTLFNGPDSMGTMGIITSPDNRFKMYNWHINLTLDIFQYYAVIQYYNKENKVFKIFYLKDHSDNLTNLKDTICTDSNWFGALYYEIIAKEFNSKKIYTLLGFDYNSFISRKKVIEILTFENDEIRLGKPMFYSNKKIDSRVLFEYSVNAIMTLRYDKPADMIVFDHLSPMNPTLEGHYEYYGPDLSYDAFQFNNGFWHYIPSVDIRNPKKPKNKK